MKATLSRVFGAVIASVPVYASTGDWKTALLTFGGFALYGVTHTTVAPAEPKQ